MEFWPSFHVEEVFENKNIQYLKYMKYTGGMEVLDGGLIAIGEENTIGEVWGNGGEETGLESVADTTGTRGTSGKGMGGVGGN